MGTDYTLRKRLTRARLGLIAKLGFKPFERFCKARALLSLEDAAAQAGGQRQTPFAFEPLEKAAQVIGLVLACPVEAAKGGKV